MPPRKYSPGRSAWRVSFGYGIAALLLLLAAVTELKYGVDAEGKSLESIEVGTGGRLFIRLRGRYRVRLRYATSRAARIGSCAARSVAVN